MRGNWTKWLETYKSTGELEEEAYQEFLRYASSIARRKGEPDRFRAKGASYVGGGAVKSALSEVDKGNVDIGNRTHFRRLLGTIVSRKVANIMRKRSIERHYLEERGKELERTNAAGILEQEVAKELAGEFQACVLAKAGSAMEERMLQLCILEDQPASAVRADLVGKYGKKNAPALRTIQLRVNKVKEMCAAELSEWVEGETGE